MQPSSVLRRAAIVLALASAAAPPAAAQSEQDSPAQTMAMQVLSDICARDMPDVAKIQSIARKRWKGSQNLKGVDYWSVVVPGQAEFALGAGKQDAGQICLVSFTGRAADVLPVLESRFNVSRSQVQQGKRTWSLTLNGRKGMVFLEDHPKSRFNINAGIYLEPPPPPLVR
jgi:hypothetical protein